MDPLGLDIAVKTSRLEGAQSCIKEELPQLARQFMQDLELYGGEEQVWPAEDVRLVMCDGFAMKSLEIGRLPLTSV